MLLGADRAAAAALRELPEALVLVFDRELRFVVTAGQALARLGNPATCREGEPVRGAFPGELWDQHRAAVRLGARGRDALARGVDGRARGTA